MYVYGRKSGYSIFLNHTSLIRGKQERSCRKSVCTKFPFFTVYLIDFT